ncbi:LuxR C-terminal-related transcriptional regulator [Uliginosibacterium sp. sgz301328]|uniref:helix-turn-helix transcriptional regulator n=1 Tax=Uliginosibacterium sp. sgz301328 TaxID=3243764 RepID=UPI00359CC9FD
MEIVGSVHWSDGAEGIPKLGADLLVILASHMNVAALHVIDHLINEAMEHCKIVAVVPSLSHPIASGLRHSGVNAVVPEAAVEATLSDVIRAVLNGYSCMPLMSTAGVPTFSHKEYSVLVGLAAGLSNKDIARNLELSPKTVSTHRANIFRKLGVRSEPEFARMSKGWAGEWPVR